MDKKEILEMETELCEIRQKTNKESSKEYIGKINEVMQNMMQNLTSNRRDDLANNAMVGFLNADYDNFLPYEEVAKKSYKMADAMIKEGNKAK